MAESITNSGNTLIPAYLALQSKGHQVRWQRSENASDGETWFADGPLGSFVADDPVQLLGLISMRELRGPSWMATDAEIDEFLTRYNA